MVECHEDDLGLHMHTYIKFINIALWPDYGFSGQKSSFFFDLKGP